LKKILLWKSLVIPNLVGQGYLGYIDASILEPTKTITTGTEKDTITTTNHEYASWLHVNQQVMSVLFGSMTEHILT
jgi:hypothetical protein